MTKSTLVDRIVELAQSEVKRWGGSEVSFTHAAIALAVRWPAEFVAVAGADAKKRVEAQLRAKKFDGEEASIRALLVSVDTVDDAIRRVYDALGPITEATADPVPEPAPAPEAATGAPTAEGDSGAGGPAQAAWLTAEIERRFAEHHATPSERIVDELYVLIATLKIAGHDQAHEEMKKRLTSIVPAKAAKPSKSGDTASGGELSDRTAGYLHRVYPAGRGLRPAESAQIAAQLLRPRAPIVAIVGESGVGRTALLGEIAARLAATDRPMAVWRMGADTIVANASASLRLALEDVRSPAVIVVDDVDLLADLGTQDPDRGLLETISDARFHADARVVLVLSPRRLGRFGVLNQALDEWLVKITIPTLAASDLVEVVSGVAESDTTNVGLQLGEGVVSAALTPAETNDTLTHPGLAIARIDTAIGRALLDRATTLGVEHLSPTLSVRSVEAESKDLAELLHERVRGQDAAIATVAARLSLTRAGLDLRPQRPNGVFLFAGPTGVGKTELATQIAIAEFGSADDIIRLDMSEYGEYEFGLSRLIGVGQGYVGQNEPDGWLTTRVTRRPRSVVLLDEVEKAHPSVWNTFLQVFDAGRLTDGRGVTADFSETIVIMTSNIGVRESTRRVAGFGDTADGQQSERQLAAIKESMPPELINRLDDVVLFTALSMEAIVEIAIVELAETRTRLRSAGWTVDYDDGVAQWLAQTGYDPAYGARHLQRNIEREFLGLLATAQGRSVRVTLTDHGLAVKDR